MNRRWLFSHLHVTQLLAERPELECHQVRLEQTRIAKAYQNWHDISSRWYLKSDRIGIASVF